MKKEDRLRKAILDMDEKLIEDAEKTPERKRTGVRWGILAAAAALMVVLTVAVTIAVLSRNAGPAGQSEPEPAEQSEAGPAVQSETEPAGRKTAPEWESVKLNGKGVQLLTAEVFSSDRAASPVSEAFRKAYASFALELLKKSPDQKGKLLSPMSVLTALQMAANGAQGKTLGEMQAVLCGMETEALNAELFNYYEGLVNTEAAKMNSANSVWITVRDDVHISEGFIHRIENAFDADVFAANLASQETADAINGWGGRKTDGMIPELLEGPLDDNTVMVLLNAISFDAKWESKFSTGTGLLPFNGASGTKDVPYLFGLGQTLIRGYGEGFYKRYEGGNYAFAAILPPAGTSLETYLDNLTGEQFLSLLGADSGEVNVKLPKISFEWNAEMKDILSGLGMPSAFREDADFGNMAWSENGGIFIGSVQHKAVIEVGEEGTKAAAVTAVIEVDTGEPYFIDFDRPFVYAIVDTATNLPVFIGTMTEAG